MARVETLPGLAASGAAVESSLHQLDAARGYGFLPVPAGGASVAVEMQPSVAPQAAPRPVKSKFSAILDLGNKTPTNCVPRLCRLNVTRIDLKSLALQPDTNAVLLAVKIQGRRRTLRSSEIALPTSSNNSNSASANNNNNNTVGGNNNSSSAGANSQPAPGYACSVDVNLEFSLQYPHFLKRSNHIEVMLQRKKHYKNRTIPGYKTLAIGKIDMAEVLQRPMDDEQHLDLYAPVKLLELPPLHISSSSEKQQRENNNYSSNAATTTNAAVASSSIASSDKASNQAAGAGAGAGASASSMSVTNNNNNTSSQQQQQTSSYSGNNNHNHHRVLLATLRLSCAASQPLPKCAVSGAKNRDVSGVSDDDISSGVEDVITDSDDILAFGGCVGDEEYAVNRRAHRHHRSGASGDTGAGSSAKGNNSSSSSKKNFKSITLSQTKFKQKIVSLLKKMKVSGAGSSNASPPLPPTAAEGAVGRSGGVMSPTVREGDLDNIFPESLEDLEADLENWAPQSDSDGDGVSLAINTAPISETTPKPSLRPFFFSDIRLSSEQLPLLPDDMQTGGGYASSDATPPTAASLMTMLPDATSGSTKQDPATRLEASNMRRSSNDHELAPSSRKQQSSTAVVVEQTSLPRHYALSAASQVEHIFQTSTDMPSHILLVFDSVQNLAKTCSHIPDGLHFVCVSSLSDVDSFFSEITRHLQKFSNAPCLSPMKIIVCGPSDAFFSNVTQSFVERFSSRLPDRTGIVRFLPVPLFAGSSIGQLLSALSFSYRNFVDSLLLPSNNNPNIGLLDSALARIASLLPLRPVELFSIPIGEVLLTIRDKSSADNRSRQIVLPFICDVQVNIVRTSTLVSSTSSSIPQLQQQQQQQQVTPSAITTNNSTSSGGTAAGQMVSQQHHHHYQQQQQQPQLAQISSGTELQSFASATTSAACGTDGLMTSVPLFDPLSEPIIGGSPPPSAAIIGNATSTTTSTNTTNNNTNLNAAWNTAIGAGAAAVAGQLPNGPSSSAAAASMANTGNTPSSSSSHHGAASGNSGTTASGSGGVVAHSSPDIASASSNSAFDVNVDYWLDTSTSSAAGGMMTSSNANGSGLQQSGSQHMSSSSAVPSSSIITSPPLLLSGGMMSSSSSMPMSSSNTTASSSHMQQQLQQQQQASQQPSGRAVNIRGSYRHMVVTRSFNYGAASTGGLDAAASTPSSAATMTMIMSARDKKIKKILLNRKSKDSLASSNDPSKGQTVIEGISRLVCTVKSSSSGHKVIVSVDGVDFLGVKFFQISPAWHSHVKNFPIFTPQLATMNQSGQYSLC